jgi:hypothetical protein
LITSFGCPDKALQILESEDIAIYEERNSAFELQGQQTTGDYQHWNILTSLRKNETQRLAGKQWLHAKKNVNNTAFRWL